MAAEFSSKWGMKKRTCAVHNAYTIAAAQFIVTMLLLCIVCPKFVLKADSHIHVGRVCFARVIATTVLITGLTYFYPMVKSM